MGCPENHQKRSIFSVRHSHWARSVRACRLSSSISSCSCRNRRLKSVGVSLIAPAVDGANLRRYATRLRMAGLSSLSRNGGIATPLPSRIVVDSRESLRLLLPHRRSEVRNCRHLTAQGAPVAVDAMTARAKAFENPAAGISRRGRGRDRHLRSARGGLSCRGCNRCRLLRLRRSIGIRFVLRLVAHDLHSIAEFANQRDQLHKVGVAQFSPHRGHGIPSLPGWNEPDAHWCALGATPPW